MTQQEIELIKLASGIIDRRIDNVINEFKNMGTKAFNELRLRTGKAFEKYLESVIVKYNKIKTIIYGETPVFIYSSYVDLDLKQGRNDSNPVDSSNINNILRINTKIIISGIAGCGKSTLLKHLLLNSIKELECIPVFIELREINDLEMDFIDFIYLSLTKLNFTLEKEYFIKALNSGNLVFLFDGLDEVNYDKRRKIEKEIIDISDKYRDNHYIISSRPNENFIGWNTYTELVIMPLTIDKSIELISKFSYFPMEVRGNFIKKLKAHLYREHNSFASNPLLLTIMFLSYNMNAEISSKTYNFYTDAFEALYRRHDASKLGFRRKKYTELDMNDFVKVLSCFSTLSYFDGKYEFLSHQIYDYLKKVKKIIGINFTENDFFEDMDKSINILIKDGLRYTYAHRTFQEYFTAVYISRLETDVRNGIVKMVFQQKPMDRVLDFLFEIDSQILEQYLIIPNFKNLINIIKYKEDNWELRYLEHRYSAIILGENINKKIAYLNDDSNVFNLMNLIIRVYPLEKWDEEIPEKEAKINEIFSVYTSYSRDKYSREVKFQFNEIFDWKVKEDIINLSYMKIKEFEIAAKLVERLNSKYENQKNSIYSLLIGKENKFNLKE